MYKTYLDFLQDQRFLEWKIIGSDELDTYWADFKSNNPDLLPLLEEAEVFLLNYKLNQEEIDEINRTVLLQKIISSNTRFRQRKKIYFYSSIAAVALIFIAIGYLLLPTTPTSTSENLAVGDQLSDQDIIFISNNRPQTFKRNIDIAIDAEGRAIVNEENKDTTLIPTQENGNNKIIVPYGKRTNLQLSDGTKIWLNSGSELEFPTIFPKEKRAVRLISGEMYIEVAPELKRYFYVQTSDFQVKVYGTKFNVSIYENFPQEVVLAQGEISISGVVGGEETMIYPNQKAVYQKNGEISKEKINAEYYTSWKDGFIELNGTPIMDILNYLERYYNISFNYSSNKNLNDITCTGKLFLSENIDNVMNAIAVLSSTAYENKDGKIYIINKK